MINRAKPPLTWRARLAWSVFRNGFPRQRPPAHRKQTAIPFMWPSWREGIPQWQIVDLQSYIDEGFNLNTLIYSAIMYKYRAIGIAKLRAYSGDPDNPDLLPPDHPLSKLVARPNPSMSWREYQGLQDVYLNLSGNAYGLLKRPRRGGLPDAMYPMRSDRVYIIPSDRGVKGYLYVPEGKGLQEGTPILPEDVSHVKLPNPGDPLEGMGYGLSPVSPMAQSADVDNMVTKFIKLFFEKGAVNSGLLKFDKPLDDDTVAGVKERWMEMYGSYENWTEIGVLDQGGDYQRIGMNFEEMSFETQDERNESRILGPFGVPPQLVSSRLGMKHSTYANWEEARRAFWEDTMTMEIGLFEDDYQYYLQSEDGGFVAFDLSEVPALRRNIPALVDAWVKLVSTGVPKNQAAQLLGLEVGDLPDGDVAYMPLNLIPVGSSALEAPETNVGAAEAEEDTREGGAKAVSEAAPAMAGKNGHGSNRKANYTPEQKAAHWKAVDKIATSWEKPFAEGARKAFEKDKREILALLTTTKAKAIQHKATVDWEDYLGDVEDYFIKAGPDNWRKVFIPLLRGVMPDQAKRWAVELGMAFDVENFFARDFLNNYVLKFATDINQTTKDIISMIIDQGQKEGWAIPTTQNHLESAFRQMAFGDVSPDDLEWYTERMIPYRSELIARDQTLRSSNAGNHELFNEWNVSKREWLTQIDGRQRDSHAEANGQIRGIDEPFDVGGYQMMFPGDDSLGADLAEIIQCRCSELPIVEGI